jgi:hypothetical protein
MRHLEKPVMDADETVLDERCFGLGDVELSAVFKGMCSATMRKKRNVFEMLHSPPREQTQCECVMTRRNETDLKAIELNEDAVRGEIKLCTRRGAVDHYLLVIVEFELGQQHRDAQLASRLPASAAYAAALANQTWNWRASMSFRTDAGHWGFVVYVCANEPTALQLDRHDKRLLGHLEGRAFGRQAFTAEGVALAETVPRGKCLVSLNATAFHGGATVDVITQHDAAELRNCRAK